MGFIIGHRGAAAYAPENTLAGFNKAHALGCCFIEFDVMLSADGEAFIFHDEKLNRTTNAKGEFGLAPASYLRTLDVGSWHSQPYAGEKIPSLHDAIQWLNETGIQANIEIKPYPGQTEQTTLAVISAIRHYWPQNKTLPLVSSFDWDALSLCHRLAPEIPLGLLMHKWQDQGLQLAQALKCFSVHLSQRAASVKAISILKQQGYMVYVYTINKKHQAIKLFNWGVDAVFSDYPDLLSELSC